MHSRHGIRFNAVPTGPTGDDSSDGHCDTERRSTSRVFRLLGVLASVVVLSLTDGLSEAMADNHAIEVRFVSTIFNITEGQGSVVVAVVAEAAAVPEFDFEVSLFSDSRTASYLSDYVLHADILRFRRTDFREAGDGSFVAVLLIDVFIINDDEAEPVESFFLRLDRTAGLSPTVELTETVAEVFIADDDTVAVTTAPDPPRDLKAIPGDRQVMLQWRTPESDGGSPIVRYDYQVDTGPWVSTGGTETSHVVGNLTNGTTYMFRVRGVNAVNEQSPSSGSESVPVSATPTVSAEGKEAVADTVKAVTAAMAANITANIGTRFSATRSGGNMVGVGGRTLNLGSAPTPSSRPVTIGRDWNLFAEPDHVDDRWDIGLDDLLRSSAFELSLSAAEDGVQNGGVSPQWTVWGRGDLQFFESQPERGATYDGDLKAGYLGIDARLGDRWLAGLATSLTRAEADYDPGDDSAGGGGRLETRITGVHPYLRYAPDAKSEFWTILGAGRGEIENERVADVTRETSDITMWMGAAGARRSLVSVEALDLALLGDVGFARVETEDGLQAIHGLTVDAWRARLGAEGSHTASLASGATLTSFVEVAGRYDGGDGDDEVGLEVSPGLYISDPIGFGLEVRGRVLALHSAENYKEHGVSMTASLSPGSDGVGLSLSLSPRWGANTEGADTLWRDDTFERLESGAAQHDAMSFDARVGYGVRAMSGLLTPFGEFSLWDQYSQQMRLGARFNRQHSGLGALSLELSGERRESPVNDPEHRVGVIGRLRF